MISIVILCPSLAKLLKRPIFTKMTEVEFDCEIQHYLSDRGLINYIVGGEQVVTLNDDLRNFCFTKNEIEIIGDRLLFTTLSRYLHLCYAIIDDNN
jgi:hypothetical protein